MRLAIFLQYICSDILALTTFDDNELVVTPHNKLPHVVKQDIARECDTERIRRHEQAHSGGVDSSGIKDVTVNDKKVAQATAHMCAFHKITLFHCDFSGHRLNRTLLSLRQRQSLALHQIASSPNSAPLAENQRVRCPQQRASGFTSTKATRTPFAANCAFAICCDAIFKGEHDIFLSTSSTCFYFSEASTSLFAFRRYFRAIKRTLGRR